MYVKEQNSFAKYFVLGFKVQNLTVCVNVANINIKLVKPVSFSWHLSRVDLSCRETVYHHAVECVTKETYLYLYLITLEKE